jgi:hypothetical protein
MTFLVDGQAFVHTLVASSAAGFRQLQRSRGRKIKTERVDAMDPVQYDASFFIVLTVAYFAFQAFTGKRFAERRIYSDDDYLSCLAMMRKCSAYDVFRLAGDVWSFSRSKVDFDFGSYLKGGRIPHYVATFARKNVGPEDLKVHSAITKPW